MPLTIRSLHCSKLYNISNRANYPHRLHVLIAVIQPLCHLVLLALSALLLIKITVNRRQA